MVGSYLFLEVLDSGLLLLQCLLKSVNHLLHLLVLLLFTLQNGLNLGRGIR